ncbi:MAG TPA: hypothetical protein VKS03_03285 [Thermoanaerobaculia bacterium]|nr:hypothetical protein [Thermoanaerobaculia bacterium]
MRDRRTTDEKFPVVDRCTVSGLVVGDICFTCRCRVLEFGGEEGMALAWCECEWADDAALMEVL